MVAQQDSLAFALHSMEAAHFGYIWIVLRLASFLFFI
jgi:hypothetical protein